MHQQNPADAPSESRGSTRIRRTPTESYLHLQRGYGRGQQISHSNCNTDVPNNDIMQTNGVYCKWQYKFSLEIFRMEILWQKRTCGSRQMLSRPCLQQHNLKWFPQRNHRLRTQSVPAGVIQEQARWKRCKSLHNVGQRCDIQNNV